MPRECPICYSSASSWYSICDNQHWLCDVCTKRLIGLVYCSVSTLGDAVFVSARTAKCPLCRQCNDSSLVVCNNPGGELSVLGTGRVRNCTFAMSDVRVKCVFCGEDFDHRLTSRHIFNPPCECRFCFECGLGGFNSSDCCNNPRRARQSPRLLYKRLAELGLRESDVRLMHRVGAAFYAAMADCSLQ